MLQDLPQYAKSLIFGGNDGALVAAALLAASAGAGLSAPYLRAIGGAAGSGMSVASGLSDYLSSKAELDLRQFERRREAWELANFPEGEREEMIELYMKKGMKEPDAQTIIGTMTKYPSFFLDHMMVEELGILPGEGQDPVMDGLSTAAGHAIFGSVPIMAVLALPSQAALPAGTALNAVCLGLLGAARGVSLGQSKLRTALTSIGVGACAGALAYGIGAAAIGSLRKH